MLDFVSWVDGLCWGGCWVWTVVGCYGWGDAWWVVWLVEEVVVNGPVTSCAEEGGMDRVECHCSDFFLVTFQDTDVTHHSKVKNPC